MKQRCWLSQCFGLIIGFECGLGALATSKTLAQSTPSNIVPDNTLLSESSVVIPNVSGLPIEAITGGAIRETNLFHSFREFNVNAGRGAYFFSPDATIQNILARVTGNNSSQILGTLGTFGESQPNLFLINPNGIVFGANASLDVGRAFVATTANAVQLGERGLFSATEPTKSNLLSVNPSALLYSAIANQAQIINRSTATKTVLRTPFNGQENRPINGLQVLDGQSLLLVGGDVRLEGGIGWAPGGRIELGGLASPGTVGLQQDSNNLSLNFSPEVQRASVSFSNNAVVNAASSGGGSIAINADNLDISGRSWLLSGISSARGTVTSQAGDITLNAAEQIKIEQTSLIGNFVLPGMTGNSGDIRITTGSLLVTNSSLNTSTDGQGNAGKVIIDARNNVLFDGSRVSTSVTEDGIGKGGDIRITTGSLSVTNGAYFAANTNGRGSAGNLIINARESVLFDKSYAASVVNNNAIGNSGDISISTGSLFMANGSILATTNIYGQGNAGNVIINARDTVSFDGRNTGLSSSVVTPEAIGNSGDIRITTGSFSLANGAIVASITFGQGNAGNVIINARDTVSFDDSNVFSFVEQEAVGKGGDIRITTGSLSLTNSAEVAASTYGKGDAGNVSIDARETVSFNGNGTGVLSTVEQGAVGQGGDISITTGSLYVKNKAELDASTLGQGNGGNVIINAHNLVSFDGAGVLSSVEPTGVGKGGDIRITTSSLTVSNSAQLIASTDGTGDAGNVIIDASDTVSFDGTNSVAFGEVNQGAVGNGGDIRITTGSLSIKNGAGFTVSTDGRGNAGNVIIDARDRISFDGNATTVFSTVEQGGVGQGGDIRITTGSLSVTNGAVLAAGTRGQGNSGNVIIDARDTVLFDGESGEDRLARASAVFSSVDPGGVGKGGDIRINTGSLTLRNGAQLVAATRTRRSGDAGNIIINARDRVLLDAGSASTGVEQGAVGKGGDIRMTTNLFQSVNGAQLLATTFGQGSAGNIQIKATDSVSVLGIDSMTGLSSALFTINASSNSSQGGDIHIDTPIFHISDGGLLDARTVSNGNGGNIIVNAKLFEALNGGQLITTTSGNGRAGKITVNATDRVIVNGSDTNFNQRVLKFPELFPLLKYTGAASGFFVFSSSSGIAGDIEVTSPKVTLDNQGRFIASSASGNGGNIKLQVTDLLLLRRESQISTNAGTAQQGGDGGNININSKYIIAFSQENSDITANAYTGIGGQVQVNSQGIFGIEARSRPTDRSDITASSELGIAGVTYINSPDTSSLRNSLNQLPENIIDTNALIANSCIARRNNRQSGTFLITGSGGLPERPGDASLSPYLTGSMQSISTVSEKSPSSMTPNRPWKIGDPIIEPQGFYQLANGKLVLSRECP